MMSYQFPKLTYSNESLEPNCEDDAVKVYRARGILLEQIINDFGSFGSFKKQLTSAVLAAEVSGTLLVWSPCFKELEILHTEKNQDLSQWGVIPLLTVEDCDHADNPQYQEKLATWFEKWWNSVNWEDVLKRFEENMEVYH